MDLVQDFANDDKRPLLLDDIRSEVAKSHRHIKEQESLLNDSKI